MAHARLQLTGLTAVRREVQSENRDSRSGRQRLHTEDGHVYAAHAYKTLTALPLAPTGSCPASGVLRHAAAAVPGNARDACDGLTRRAHLRALQLDEPSGCTLSVCQCKGSHLLPALQYALQVLLPLGGSSRRSKLKRALRHAGEP